MTLEEKAEEWLKNNLHSTEEDYKKAYLAGYKEALKMKLNTTIISDAPLMGRTRYVGLPICGIELKSYYKDGKELVDYKGKTYEVGCETCGNHDADSCCSCGLGMESYSLNTSSDPLSVSKE